MRRRMIGLAVILVVVGVAASARAQTVVVNPVTVEFAPSSDHAVIALDGQPMVARYEMRIYVETPLGPTPAFTQDIGKPTPVAGKITVTNAVWFSGLTPNTRYVAKVAAVGPTGEGVSDPSNPFGLVGAPTAPTLVVVRR